jgi:hypothetical protein
MTTSVGGRWNRCNQTLPNWSGFPTAATRLDHGVAARRDLNLPPVAGRCRPKTAPEQRQKTQIADGTHEVRGTLERRPEV